MVTLTTRLRNRARRNGTPWFDARPIIDLMGHSELALDLRDAHSEGMSPMMGTPRVKALHVDRNFQPLKRRVLRDLRVDTDGSTLDRFVATARGRLDGSRRQTARLMRAWADVSYTDRMVPIIVIMAESDL